MKTKIILFLCAITLCFSACKKDKYQPKGDYVTTGTNVNTVKTYNFTVNTSDWIGSSNPYYHYYGIDVATDMNGAVMVYYKSATSNDYAALPLIVSGSQSIQFTFNTNTILEIDLIGMVAQTCSFRCVVIPPGSRLAHPEIDYTNYEAVKKAFSLKD